MTTCPNILLITADDMEGTTLGVFGGPPGVTPTLDALAEQSAVLERAQVAIAVPAQPHRDDDRPLAPSQRGRGVRGDR